jgi:uncharacterized protein with HEPN domain
MNERTWRLFLEDLVESIEKIDKYIDGMDYDSFAGDEKTVDAVVRNLEIVGEASKNIPDSIKAEHSEIPWHRMSGLRNVLAHEYFGIDLNIIWKIIKENLPEVMPLLNKILNNT